MIGDSPNRRVAAAIFGRPISMAKKAIRKMGPEWAA